jgi:hypothetical protein
MSEIGHSSHQAITDAAELAFMGMDFKPMPEYVLENDPNCAYTSGSERLKVGYDPAVQCAVEVSELVGFIDEAGVPQPVRRLYAEWDNGESYELDLESGEVILSEDEPDISDEAQDLIRQRLKQSLLAVMSDVL